MARTVTWRNLGVLRWLPRYTRHQFFSDVMAAAVVAVVLIPQGMAYALLAGLDPIYGLYSSTIPLIVFALFTTSSQVAVGPVAPTAILMETMIRGLTAAAPRSPEFTRYHIALAFTSGVVQLVLAVMQFGWVASMLSWPVMSGFSTAAACIIMVSQIPDLLRLRVPRENMFFMRLYRVVENLPTIHWQTAVLGIVCAFIILFAKEVKVLGRKLPRKFPVPLFVVAMAVIVSFSLGLEEQGIRVVGDVPSSLPEPSIPLSSAEDLQLLLPSAVILGFINYVQTVTLCVMFGKRKGESVNPGTELVALGMSSLVGSFFSCHTVAGSFTRTALQADAGAVTPMTTALTATFMIGCILTLTRVFRFLPTAVLAAIVLASAKPLISIADMKVLWRGRKSDLAQLLSTLFAVLLFDLSNGLLIGVGVSLLTLLYRSFRPRLTELGRLPGTDVFVALARYPETRPIPGVVVLRLDGELHFGNVSTISDKLTSFLLAEVARDAVTESEAEHMLTSGNAAIAPRALKEGVELVPLANVQQLTADISELVPSAEGASSNSAPGSGQQPPASANSGGTGVVRARETEVPPTDGLAAQRGLVQRAVAGTTSNPSPGNGRMRVVYALATVPEDNVRSAPQAKRAAQALLADGGDPVALANVTHAVARSLSRHFGASADASADSSATTSPIEPRSPASETALSEERGFVSQSYPLRAVILDASRVVDIDATACRELQSVMETFAKTALKGNRRVLMLFSGLPGPVRDTLDRFGVDKATDPASTRFLTVAAAVASLAERQREQNWDTITRDLAGMVTRHSAQSDSNASDAP